jgi:hypothetical protein
MADNALVVNIGTALTMASDDISSVHYPRVKIAVGADGAAADWQGTINSVAALTSGSVRMTVGTITTGSITNLASLISGSVDTLGIGRRHADEFATVISSGTSTLGTIRAAVSGSAIYVTSLIISAGSATNVEIASGGTSTPILGTLHLAAQGGAALMPIDPPLRTASGSALVYKQSVNGPLTITATGYID